MQYRIEISTSREGVAKVHLPGRSLELQARGDADAGWQVAAVTANLWSSLLASARTCVLSESQYIIPRS